MALVFLQLALVLPGSSSASGFFVFSRTIAEPGERVVAETGGKGAFGAGLRGRTMPVFLVPADAVEHVRTGDDRLTPLGLMRVDPEGDGSLTFRVPNLPPGEYVTIVHCRACASSSGGRVLLPFGPFDEPFHIRAGSTSPFRRILWPAALVASGLLVGVFAARLAGGWRTQHRAGLLRP